MPSTHRHRTRSESLVWAGISVGIMLILGFSISIHAWRDPHALGGILALAIVLKLTARMALREIRYHRRFKGFLGQRA